MANGRCRMHGGKSTGPCTQADGLSRSPREIDDAICLKRAAIIDPDYGGAARVLVY
jgi:hypothetical protein